VKRIDIPETITDAQMTDLRNRAAPGSWLATESVAARDVPDDVLRQWERRDLS
jgi:hypothetical protein